MTSLIRKCNNCCKPFPVNSSHFNQCVIENEINHCDICDSYMNQTEYQDHLLCHNLENNNNNNHIDESSNL